MSNSHFTTHTAGTPTAAGRYVNVQAIEPVEFVPGLVFRPVLGERTMTNFVHFEPNTEAPMHVHEEEQIVIVLDGEFEFELDGDVRTMRPGDVAVVPPWVPHGAKTKDTRCDEVDVFNPPRQTLLEHAQDAAKVRRRRRGEPGLMELGLTGRRAVVTGGSKGIGLEVAKELVREGASVAICARNRDEVAAAAKELRELGSKVHDQVVDVTVPDQITRFITAAASTLGGIDILVNNAGAAHPGTFETLTDEDWHGDLDVKLFSQIRCTRAALPHLRQSPAPRVINVNAVYAKYPDPKFFATTVNRAACLNLSKTLALQYGPEGILVNSVNIGFVVTPQWQNIRNKRAPELSQEEFFAGLAAEEVPLGRFGDVSEVSGLIAFLASDRASYITGTSIDVAGGMGKYV